MKNHILDGAIEGHCDCMFHVNTERWDFDRLAALVARRFGLPVYHMEAGNRCFDDRVPEEVNRRVIDHSSSVLMPYTQRSRENLLREGISGERIYVTGNPVARSTERGPSWPATTLDSRLLPSRGSAAS